MQFRFIHNNVAFIQGQPKLRGNPVTSHPPGCKPIRKPEKTPHSVTFAAACPVDHRHRLAYIFRVSRDVPAAGSVTKILSKSHLPGNYLAAPTDLANRHRNELDQ